VSKTPTSFPAGTDTFTIPTSPGTTNLSDPGAGSTRNHPQHHKDLGDAVMALESNVALLNHDHAGIVGGTSRLLQMNTHQSADTDSSTSSLHHTLGSGATQAAQGNHNHSLPTELTTVLFGGSTRTVAPTCEVYYTGGPVTVSGDAWAAGGWSTAGPNIDTDGMFSFSGGYASILIPVTGRYYIQLHSSGSHNTSPTDPRPILARVTAGRDVQATICASSVSHAGNIEVQLDAVAMRKLPAGMRLFWAHYAAGQFTMRNIMFGYDTFMLVRYMGPV